MGKTTTACKFPKSLLIALEKGYSAIPGVRALPVNTWGEFKQILTQLKKPEARETYSNIIVDTVDIAVDLCVKYICSNAGVDKIGDVPFGQGYTLVAKELDECLRRIPQLGFGCVMISHSTDKTFTDESGVEYNKIVPTLDKKATNIVSRMADIIGYSRAVKNDEGEEVTKLFMRGTTRFVAGSRFPYTPDHIDFTYENLVKAISDSIDKQAAENGAELFTNEKMNAHAESEELDFDKLIEEFKVTASKLLEEDGDYWAPRITEVVEKYIGRGKKVMECDRRQVEAIDLIVSDLKELKK